MSSEPSKFWILVDQTYHAVNRYVMSRLWQAGFTDLRLAHCKVFENLDPHLEGTHTTILAERAEMTKQAMGELVSDLERLGYAYREADPADRRARLVLLTKRGKAAWHAAVACLGELQTIAETTVGASPFLKAENVLDRVSRAVQDHTGE
jgi:DNA-binding MarR family transcriptional regulator